MAPAHHFVQIDCPDTGRPIIVARNLRDDPIARLFVGNQISQHQRAAAEAYQNDHEAMAGAHRAPSHGPEDVAGWRSRRPGGNSKRHDRLARARNALGPDLSRLMQSALIDGALPTRTGLRELHQALDRLAVVYGFSTATRH
jgi:hypothetical protein